MSRRSREDVLNEIGFQFRSMQTDFEDHDAAVGSLLELNTTDMRVLDFLGRAGDPHSLEGAPITAGDLARESGLTTGAVTAVLDRLERAGWARRLPDPADRRRVVVQQTDKATRAIAALYGPLKGRGDAKLARFTVRELELVLSALRAAREVTVEHTEELRQALRERDAGRDAAA
jgi:DNA-binding MarR family transcriptional regulator